MRLRYALARDVKALVLLESELFDAYHYPLSRQSFYYHIRHNLLMVVEEEGVVVGYGLVQLWKQKAKLYSIGIAAQYRGRGYAKELLMGLKAELVNLKKVSMTLEVDIYNHQAVQLYEGMGFKRVKLLKAFYKDGSDAWLMESDYADTALLKAL